jgi:U3 small nucleolar RNA-associated protein 4
LAQLTIHRYVRTFDKNESRVLSLAWHPDGKHLVCGSSDGNIRKIIVSTGNVVDRMILGAKSGEETLIWSVLVLKDGTVVSGDSLGDVTFWDWRTCTQKCTVNSHEADILCMVADAVCPLLLIFRMAKLSILLVLIETSFNTN